MTWTLNNTLFESIPDDCTAIGFVYLITNTVSNKKYIGKKNFYTNRTKVKTVTLKTGLKKKKNVKVKAESDWMNYYGSSEELKKDVYLHGTEKFTRQILRLCYTKGHLSYFEAKYQFDYDVLLKPDQFYNRWNSVKVHGIHLKSISQQPQEPM
jgi:hypothetical protein